MKKTNLHLLLGLCLAIVPVFAQETLPISKSELIEKIAKNNLQIKMAAQEVLAAKGDYDQSRAVFLPNVNVSHTGI